MFHGLRPKGVFLINRAKLLTENPNENMAKVGVINATGIAIEELGTPIPNTCMLGAFASLTRWVTLDSVFKSLAGRFDGERLEKNIKAAQRGFNEVKIIQWDKEGIKR